MSTDCRLSLGGRAFSTVLTAFVSSMVTGISNGHLVAFHVGWICWLAGVRIIGVSLAGVVVTVLGPCLGIRQPFLAALPTSTDGANDEPPLEAPPKDGRPLRNRDVTLLGSMGWIYTFIYAPVIHVLWVKANWSKAPSVLFVSRAIGVSVTALSYTIDTQARYGTALGKKLGSNKIVPRLMNLYSAVMNMLLSIIVVLLLIRALVVVSESEMSGVYKVLALPYIISSFIWAYSSLKLFWPSDEGWSGASLRALWTCDGSLTNTLKEIALGLFMGAFAGIFVAAPSIVMWQDAEFESWGQAHGLPSDDRFTNGQGLGKWLQCTTDSWWKKAVQILP